MSSCEISGPEPGLSRGYWEHFPHEADVGIRGVGPTKSDAFVQAARALTAVIADLETIRPVESVAITCAAPNDELLLVDWLNALVYEMATRKMLFSSFAVKMESDGLHGRARGEPVDVARHKPVVEVKGATLAELRVDRNAEGQWLAQCIVDV
jgi:SHS2 domain-containing protein